MGFVFRPRIEELLGPGAAQPLVDLAAQLPPDARPVLLDSAGGRPARFSLLAFDPLPAEPPAGLAALRSYLGLLRAAEDPAAGDPFPPGPAGTFRGGFLGALAYDLGVVDEELDLPRDPWGLAPIAGALYTDFVVRDEGTGRTWLVLGEDPGDGRASVAERVARLRRAFEARSPAALEPLRPCGPWSRGMSADAYRSGVDRVREMIADGEIYQANLSQPFDRAVEGSPLELYRRLRGAQSAPYAGFADFGEFALLSVSPELLLEWRVGEEGPWAETRPIKGTAPRAKDEALDRQRAEELRASAKDRAELGMIVDLERNDLGRIARRGGVRVGEFPRLESYANVHHLVADVGARPRPGLDAIDALCALFPGGSITGAPKLRSMEVLAELEGEGRGYSFGALGALSLHGEARFNLLIRTLLWRARPGTQGAGELRLRVGAGITYASEAVREEEETRWKAEALWAAVDRRPTHLD